MQTTQTNYIVSSTSKEFAPIECTTEQEVLQALGSLRLEQSFEIESPTGKNVSKFIQL